MAVNVTCMAEAPASTSLIENALLFTAENTLLASFGVSWGPGTLFTGASLTEVTVSETVTTLELSDPSLAL